jgi:hypothetical protein
MDNSVPSTARGSGERDAQPPRAANQKLSLFPKGEFHPLNIYCSGGAGGASPLR